MGEFIFLFWRILVLLLPANPAAFPGTLGVEDLKAPGLAGEHARCGGRFGQNHRVAVVHVVYALGEELPEEAASAGAPSASGVKKRLVDDLDEGVPEGLVQLAVLGGDAEFGEDDGHAQLPRVVYVSLHPRRRELELSVGGRSGQPYHGATRRLRISRWRRRPEGLRREKGELTRRRDTSGRRRSRCPRPCDS